MIKDFKYYLESQLAKRASVDFEEAKALMKKSEGRLSFSIKTREINDNTAPYIFEDIYECLREASQALMSLRGYKPYSHEALIAFLKEFFIFSLSDISALDRYRMLRNKTVYSGEKITSATCKEAFEFLLSFLPKLKAEFEKLSK